MSGGRFPAPPDGAPRSSATLILFLLIILLPSMVLTAVDAEPSPSPSVERKPEPTPKAKPKEDFKYYSFVFEMCTSRCARDGCATVRMPRSGEEVNAGGCVAACKNGGPKEGGTPSEFPLALRVLRWDCASDCQYRCMESLQKVRNREGLQAAKYYGKWAFTRVWGAQEIVSCVASLVNAAVHVWHAPMLLAAAVKGGGGAGAAGRAQSSAVLWLINGTFHLNCWVWSAVFHARETSWTHFMDYTSANVLFFFAGFAAIVRVRGWRLQRAHDLAELAPLTIATVALLVLHVRHVTTPTREANYNYGFNIKMMAACATLHWTLMLAWAYAYRPWWWCAPSRLPGKEGVQVIESSSDFEGSGSVRQPHPGRHALAACCASWHVAALAEVLDFPPWRGILDAHALWHCATPLCGWIWYRFVAADLAVSLPPTGADGDVGKKKMS